MALSLSSLAKRPAALGDNQYIIGANSFSFPSST